MSVATPKHVAVWELIITAQCWGERVPLHIINLWQDEN